MTTLHLGVIDVAYSSAAGKKHGDMKHVGTETTSDVAGWLENRYHVMEIFFELRREKIADDLAEAISGEIENLVMGAPPRSDPFSDACSGIDKDFRQFLDKGEIEQLGIPGIRTMAAKRGVNHRKKSGYNKNFEQRVSFVDTGLYSASFRSWCDSSES